MIVQANVRFTDIKSETTTMAMKELKPLPSTLTGEKENASKVNPEGSALVLALLLHFEIYYIHIHICLNL